MQLYYEAKVFLQFISFFEPHNRAKITKILGYTSFVVSPKYLHLPCFPSFEQPLCFMLPSVLIPQNFLQFTIFLITLNRAFPDKSDAPNQHRKKALFTNGLNLPLASRMSCRTSGREYLNSSTSTEVRQSVF